MELGKIGLNKNELMSILGNFDFFILQGNSTKSPSFYIITGWPWEGQAVNKTKDVFPEGAFYFNQVVETKTNTSIEGVYIYPDWSSCVTGTWTDFILNKGQYCEIIESCNNDDGEVVAIKTKLKENSPTLAYSPPSYNSFGPPPTQRDPYEGNTVEVKPSSIRNNGTSIGDGLFTKRNIKNGEVIAFYSGYCVKTNTIITPFERGVLTPKERLYISTYVLQKYILGTN